MTPLYHVGMIGTGNNVSYLGLNDPTTIWAFKRRCDANHIKRMLCNKKHQYRPFKTEFVCPKTHKIEIDFHSQLVDLRKDVHVIHTDLTSATINELKFNVPVTLVSNVQLISESSFQLCIDNTVSCEDLHVLTEILYNALPCSDYLRLLALEKTFSNI